MRTPFAVAVAALAGLCVVALGAQVPALLTLARVESKRDVANKLLSLAEKHKELSLHDVLRDREHLGRREGATNGSTERAAKENSERAGRKRSSSVVRKIELQQRKRSKGRDSRSLSVEGIRAQKSRSQPGDVTRDAIRADARKESLRPARGHDGETPGIQGAATGLEAKDAGRVVVSSWSEQFAHGVNGTIRHSELAAYVNISATVVTAGEIRSLAAARGANLPELRRPTEFATMLFRGAARDPLPVEKSPPSTPQLPVALPVLAALNELELRENEADVMLRALGVLKASPVDDVDARVEALLILEELCHGAEEASDLQAAGGLKVVVSGLSSQSSEERASAALTLSACAQNNPGVQKDAVDLGAVPVLMQLAAGDEPSVCSRALLALNALVELNAARQLLEDVVSNAGIEALRRPLVEQTNLRATRRALNLAEVLAARNLDAWKTNIEAWDLSPVIERLLFHENPDIRESAARLVAVLESF